MEIIKLQQLEADEKVVVDFLTVKSTTDLYGLVKDDLLLVKRQLTAEDARWLQSFKGHCDVFTMFPESIEAFDAGSEIGINEVASIGLCFLHTGDSLYVFDNDISKSETPNVVRISPVRRKEIGTYISVDEKVVAPVESSGTENPALEQEHNSEPVELSQDGVVLKGEAVNISYGGVGIKLRHSEALTNESPILIKWSIFPKINPEHKVVPEAVMSISYLEFKAFWE